MKSRTFRRVAALVVACVAATVVFTGASLQAVPRRHKHKRGISANDPTAQLYNLLNQSMDGRLGVYLLADTYTDPSNPSLKFQRVLHVLYNKNLFFGRLTIHVRSVSKLTAQQLLTYTPQQIFDFASEDTKEFEKIDPGPFGRTGDLYLLATGNRPLASAAITPDVEQEYSMLVTSYILPAVQKQAAAKH